MRKGGFSGDNESYIRYPLDSCEHNGIMRRLWAGRDILRVNISWPRAVEDGEMQEIVVMQWLSLRI